MFADLLKLDKPERYTEHSLWQTLATLLADSGVHIMILKCQSESSSDDVAEGYVEES